MRIGIDASNIKSDGGVVHLLELLNNLDTKYHNIEKIVIWGNFSVLKKIKNNNKFHKIYTDRINKNLISRIFWQLIFLPNNLVKQNCNIFFVLGGFFFRKKIKTVSIFQNILPFIEEDIKKYGLIDKCKLFIQKKAYIHTFKESDGIIFLSKFSKKILTKNLNLKNIITTIIPHGVSSIFKFKKKNITNKKIRLLYVSKLDIYKNQMAIIFALFYLKKDFNIKLSLIGSYDKKNKKILDEKIKELNLEKDIKIYGKVNYYKLPSIYHKHDIKIYASKSETFGLTMLEAIKSGLPVLAVKNEISQEILLNAAFYCKNSSIDIANKLKLILKDKKNLNKKIMIGKKIADKYDWKTTSKNTFKFLKKING